MVKYILPLIPEHKIYIEPFCGGASLFFSKEKATASNILNDYNENIINFYKCARDRKLREKLINLVECTLHCETTYKKTIDIYRNPCKHTMLTRAYATWYQCNFSFCQKPKGGFARADNYADKVNGYKKAFTENISKLDNVTLYNCDAIDAMRKHNKPDTFAYIDPPYFNSDCGHYKGYTVRDFTDLLEFLTTEFRGKFLLSSYPSEVLTKYIEKYQLNNSSTTTTITAGRHIIRKQKTESLTWNYQVKTLSNTNMPLAIRKLRSAPKNPLKTNVLF